LPDLNPEDIELLEHEIDRIDKQLPALKHFILPGGSATISYCHIARCVCRRAERLVVHLDQESTVDEKVVVYLNRLSDYLFTLARKIANDLKIHENEWIPRMKKI
ncbi:MAG: ATP:cob(I)alamin adenosyltransferase, partial [Bacteroidota bacterium]